MAVTAISVLGVDLGKNVCSVVGLDAAGAVVMRRRRPAAGPIISAGCSPPAVMTSG